MPAVGVDRLTEMGCVKALPSYQWTCAGCQLYLAEWIWGVSLPIGVTQGDTYDRIEQLRRLSASGQGFALWCATCCATFTERPVVGLDLARDESETIVRRRRSPTPPGLLLRIWRWFTE